MHICIYTCVYIHISFKKQPHRDQQRGVLALRVNDDQGWVVLKSEAWNSIQAASVASRARSPWAIFYCFPRQSSREQYSWS